MTTIGLLPLARATFDVPFAEQVRDAAVRALDELDAEVVGATELLLDAAATDAAIADLAARELDLLLVLQVTFTDADAVVRAAERIDAPIALWAFPEARTGGRLRLNAFCGINLAGHALTGAGHGYDYLYRDADDPDALRELREILAGRDSRTTTWLAIPDLAGLREDAVSAATVVRDRLRAERIGLVGDHPDGFHPCRYDPATLAATVGIGVDRVELDDVFAVARAVSDDTRAQVRARVGSTLAGVDEVDQQALDRTLDTYAALRAMADERGWNGVAVRCWPEMFTDHGGAACAAMGMLTDEDLPAACERDVYGNVTEVALSALADGAPAFIADLVDLDRASETGVLWHCGLAPLSMADPQVQPRAGLHSNRQQPLVHEFPLRAGRITIARLHQTPAGLAMVIAGGEMLEAPASFSGTSGVCRFDRDADAMLATIMDHGLEHHYAFVYADVREELRALAALWDLPVLEIA
jgi:L-fucose isomerase-like protein